METIARPSTTYGTPEACRLAGVTYRQADYWVRIGLLPCDTPARGSGSARRFSGRQVQVMWALGRLGLHAAGDDVVRALADAPEFAGLLILSDVLGPVVVSNPLDVYDVVCAAGQCVILDLDLGPAVT